MLKNWKAALATLVLAAGSFGAGAVFTSGAQARGEWGSAANLYAVRSHLGSLIGQLERDSHDYGGHRVDAINDMQQATSQITQALQYDSSHPGH